MGHPKNINEALEAMRRYREKTGQEVINFHMQLVVIRDEELWRDVDWWAGGPRNGEDWVDVPWQTFVSRILGKTAGWVEKVTEILLLENGRELLVEHGITNMFTYLRATVSDRAEIIKYANTHRATRFAYILNHCVNSSAPKKPVVCSRKHDATAKKVEKLERDLKESQKCHATAMDNIEVLSKEKAQLEFDKKKISKEKDDLEYERNQLALEKKLLKDRLAKYDAIFGSIKADVESVREDIH